MSHRTIDSLPKETLGILSRYTCSCPVKLGSIARELGIAVKVSNLRMGISGQISKEENQYIIRVNRYESRERQRFTIAHELAHYLLHRDIIDSTTNGIHDNILYRSGQPLTVEYEANLLAADIVMPSALLKKKLCDIKHEINEDVIVSLAEEFQVSRGAMDVRLSYLGYK